MPLLFHYYLLHCLEYYHTTIIGEFLRYCVAPGQMKSQFWEDDSLVVDGGEASVSGVRPWASLSKPPMRRVLWGILLHALSNARCPLFLVFWNTRLCTKGPVVQFVCLAVCWRCVSKGVRYGAAGHQSWHPPSHLFSTALSQPHKPKKEGTLLVSNHLTLQIILTVKTAPAKLVFRW